MRRLVLAAALLLAACGGGGTTQTVRQAVAGAATVYATASIAFTAYASLPRCAEAVPKPCSEAARVVKIGAGLLAARDAVDLARAVALSLPADAPVTALSPEQRTALDGAAAAVGGVNTQITEASR